MARAEVNPSHFVSSHSTHPHLSSPLPKRSRLSLRRTTQVLHKPCYKEDDSLDIKRDTCCVDTNTDVKAEDISSIEMIDLTQDENTSPNCNVSSVEAKSEPTSIENEDENKFKVWTLGLPNCGNTCYVNSILQVLRYTPDFLNSLHLLTLAQHQLSKVSTSEDETKELLFFKNMHLLFSAMKRKEALMRINVDKDYCAFLLKPVKLVISTLREISLLFEEGQQHDAHELLITTIAAFSTASQSLKKLITSSEEDFVRIESSPTLDSETGSSTMDNTVYSAGLEIKRQTSTAKRRKTKHCSLDSSVLENLSLGFEGKIRHVVQCLECEKRLEREESFANLEVNIPELDSGKDSVELRECLSQTNILSGENKFFCEDCQHYNEARMSSEVVSLPPILLLHFSWLRRSSEVSDVEKTSIKVIIPQSLETSENTEVFCCTPDQNYKLFAVVLHIGRSTEGGHYVSFIKDASQDIVMQDCEQKPIKPKIRSSSQFTIDAEQCCTTEEIVNFKAVNSTTKWLLFDDNMVSPVCIDEDSDSFPYFNYLSITASPCMIFYHKS